uniref:Uncharacterized protein n=1 Tax=Picea sitchensis TaxID=3332 RepID=A9NLX2_PICSI|nr:unknown [Picea sitchensis]
MLLVMLAHHYYGLQEMIDQQRSKHYWIMGQIQMLRRMIMSPHLYQQ